MAVQQKPLVIAHRGASGYLPEHTFPAFAMAHAMGADYIELDIVLSKDSVPVVMHDLTLEATTNVADMFPGRARANRQHYAVDYTFEELQKLSVHERVNRTGKQRYVNRFPGDAEIFRLHSLNQVLSLVQGLNHSTGRNTGVYVELKSPAWHSAEGKDIVSTVLNVLRSFGYTSEKDRIYLQSFDQQTLRQLKEKTAIPLIQLIGENRWWRDDSTDYDHLKTPEGIREISTYADGIGPWIGQLQLETEKQSRIIRDAHSAGLVVHPYTLRADQLPEAFSSFDALLHALFSVQEVDGVFTDFPDLVREFVDGL